MPRQKEVSDNSSDARESLAHKAAQMASKEEQISCQPNEKMTNTMLNGSPTATKLLYVSGLFPKSALNAGATMKWTREELTALFRVHARDSKDRDLRRGDVSEVSVNEISLLSTFNGLDVPVELSAGGAMKGKTYCLAYETGRSSGKHRNLLWVINPGSHHFHSPMLIYRRLKQELMHLARVAGSFEISGLMEGVKELDDTFYMVNAHSFMANLIHRNADKWNVPWNSFEVVRNGAFRLIPMILINWARDLLCNMRSALDKNKHDLSALSFTCTSVCSRGSVTSEYLQEETEILIGMHLLVTYTFLQPHKLLAEYTPA